MGDLKLQSQQRAAFAHQCIVEALKTDSSIQKEVKSYIQSLPAMIQMNGFGQAIAFYKSHPPSKRGGTAYQMLYTWLSNWLVQQNIYSNDLMTAICNESMQHYQLATAETQALLVWLKKFARAYLDIKKNSEE